jgi:hypothetical protein
MKRPRNPVLEKNKSRGVSNTVGFIIILGVVVSAVFISFSLGVGLLSDAGDRQALQANEQASTSMKAELDQSTGGQSARPSVSVGIADSQLYLENATMAQINITLGNRTFGNYTTSRMVYDVSEHGANYYYAFGHVYRVEREQGAAPLSIASPQFDFHGDEVTLTIPLLSTTTAESPSSVSADGARELDLLFSERGSERLERVNVEGGTPERTQGHIWINNSQSPSVWETYFREYPLDNVTTTASGNVRASFIAEEVTVFTARYDVNFGGGE